MYRYPPIRSQNLVKPVTGFGSAAWFRTLEVQELSSKKRDAGINGPLALQTHWFVVFDSITNSFKFSPHHGALTRISAGTLLYLCMYQRQRPPWLHGSCVYRFRSFVLGVDVNGMLAFIFNERNLSI
jgi:hypothetical protein